MDVLSECLRCCCCFQAGEEVGLRVRTQTATVKPKTSRQVVWDALIGSGGLVLAERDANSDFFVPSSLCLVA